MIRTDISTVEQVLLQKKRVAENRKRGSKKVKLPKTPRILEPKGIERAYQRELRKLVNRTIELVKANVLSQVPSLVSLNDLLLPKTDSIKLDATPEELLQDLIRATEINLSRQLTDAEVQAIAREYAVQVDLHNRGQLSKVFRNVLGVDLVADNPAIDKAITAHIIENTELIKNVSSEFLRETQRIINDGFRRGLRAEEISKQILGKTDLAGKATPSKKAINRANLIARDQINKLNGQINKVRQQSLGINKFTWITAGDERVRDTHRIDGSIFTWDSPVSTNSNKVKPGFNLNPGEDINCRCYAEPIFEEEFLN